jgi:peptide/nickel transport system substrate-binding protein
VPSVGSGGVSADGRTITYELREGAAWHDGLPVTGQDVVATWDYLRSQTSVAEREPFPGFELIEDVTAEGPRVDVRLARPFGPAPETLFPYVLPGHLLPDAQGVANAELWAAPVGSGPFRLVRWEDGARWVLEAATEDARPRPDVERIDVVFDGEDATERFAGSPAGVWTWIDEVELPTLERDVPADYRVADTGRWVGGVLDVDAPHLDDPLVRSAISAAYPMERLFGEVLPGEAPTTPVAPILRAETPAGEEIVHDSPDRARALLAEAGWVDTDGDGLVDQDGETLVLNVDATARRGRDETLDEQMTMVQDALREAGFDALTNPFRSDYYSSWWRQGWLATASHSLGLGVYPSEVAPGWGGAFDPRRLPGLDRPRGEDVAFTEDDVLEGLYLRAEGTYEPGRARDVATGIVSRILDERLAVFERYETRAIGVRGPVEGYAPARYPAGDFWNVREWRVDEDGQQ